MTPAITRRDAKARAWENYLAVPAAAAVAGAVSLWALFLDRVPPFSLTEGEITPTAVRGGETISARWRVTLTRDAPYSQVCTREIIDSLGTFRRVDEQERESILPPKENYIARSVNVPFEAAWGRAYYRQSCCYEFEGISLTQIFPICIRRPIIPFQILPPAKT